MKRGIFFFTALMFLLSISLSCFAVSNGHRITLTLKDAILLALRNNPDLESAELERIVQKYDVVVAKNQFEPQYSFTASTNYNSSTIDRESSSTKSANIRPTVSLLTAPGTKFTLESDNPIINGRYNPAVTLKVEQPLIRGFGKAVVEAALNNALDNEKINKLSLKQTVISTVNTIIADYMNFVSAHQILKSDLLTLRGYQRTVQNDREMIAAGRLARNDIYQPLASLTTQKATIQQDKNQIVQTELKLINDIGLKSNTAIDLPKSIDYEGIAKTLINGDQLPSLATSRLLALSNNINYQIEGITLHTLKRSLLTATDNSRWQLNLTASATSGGGTTGGHNGNFESLTNGRNHNEAVGLELSIPIDDVHRKQAVINAEVSLHQGFIKYNEQKRQLELLVLNDYNDIQTTKNQLALSKKALKLHIRTLQIARLKKQAGRISTFELLNDQKDLQSAEISVIQNQIAYIESLVNYNDNLGSMLTCWNIQIRY